MKKINPWQLSNHFNAQSILSGYVTKNLAGMTIIGLSQKSGHASQVRQWQASHKRGQVPPEQGLASLAPSFPALPSTLHVKKREITTREAIAFQNG